MNRVIKFRAWDEVNEYMFIADGITTATWPLCYAWNNQEEQNIPIKSEHLMQYTGLEDKNGVLIYEGDIVKTIALSNDHHQRGAIVAVVVEYSMGNFCLGDSGPTIYPFNVTHEIEVIGNIYENPELLKDKS